VLKNYRLVLIDSELQELLLINEDDVFYFEGVWKIFNDDDEDNFKTHNDLAMIDSNTNVAEKEGGNYSTSAGVWNNPMGVFGIGIFHTLYGMGIGVEIIRPMIPQLFESYKKQRQQRLRTLVEENPEKDYEEWAKRVSEGFLDGWYGWDNRIKGWEIKCAMLSGFSDEERALYNKVGDLVTEFDWMIPAESDVCGEGQWCTIVQNTIEIVKTGGGVDEVVNHLSKYGTDLDRWKEYRPEDTIEDKKNERLMNERMNERRYEYKKERIEVAKKIVWLIKKEILRKKVIEVVFRKINGDTSNIDHIGVMQFIDLCYRIDRLIEDKWTLLQSNFYYDKVVKTSWIVLPGKTGSDVNKNCCLGVRVDVEEVTEFYKEYASEYITIVLMGKYTRPVELENSYRQFDIIVGDKVYQSYEDGLDAIIARLEEVLCSGT